MLRVGSPQELMGFLLLACDFRRLSIFTDAVQHHQKTHPAWCHSWVLMGLFLGSSPELLPPGNMMAWGGPQMSRMILQILNAGLFSALGSWDILSKAM